MEILLFSERSIWTMIHGLALGGAALLALAAALFALAVTRPAAGLELTLQNQARYLAGVTVFIAVVLWLTVIVGTYVNFPPYRAPPPEGATELSRYPAALIRSTPETVWLHSFAMEIKEHIPWIAAMLATAAAFIGVRHRARLLSDPELRRLTTTLLAVCFGLVASVAVLGVFINKVAPLE